MAFCDELVKQISLAFVMLGMTGGLRSAKTVPYKYALSGRVHTTQLVDPLFSNISNSNFTNRSREGLLHRHYTRLVYNVV
jgi:hypothetical protein